MLNKIIITTLILAAIPLALIAILLWYPVAVLLRFAKRDVPYPHEHFSDFMKGEALHVH